MAATPPVPSFPETNKFLKQRVILSHSPHLLSSNFRYSFSAKCSFENHRNSTIEHFSTMSRESIHNNSTNSSFSSSLVSASSSGSQINSKHSKKVVLFYSAETKSLAYNIASESDAIELRSISWGFVILHFLTHFHSHCYFEFSPTCSLIFSNLIDIVLLGICKSKVMYNILE